MPGSRIALGINQAEGQRLGYSGISLTEFDTVNEPKIAESSKVEVGGALFTFSPDETISGWSGIGNNNDVWVKLVVSGSSVTGEFTVTPPTGWDDARQGWYATDDRYVAWLRKDGSGNAIYKNIIPVGQKKELHVEETIEIGAWDMRVDTIHVATELEVPQNIRGIEAFVREDSGVGMDKLPVGGSAVDGEMQGWVDHLTYDEYHPFVSNFSLVSLTGGGFDGLDYSSTANNRGWIVFKYKII